MGLAESAVTYQGLLASAGGAHGLGRISARDALDSWLVFLQTCTTPSPICAWFEFPVTPGLKARREAQRRVREAFPGSTRCAVPWSRVNEAMEIFESLEPLPVNDWGMAPIWLWFTSDFRLLRPNSREVWPGQDPARFGDFVTAGGVRLGSSSTRLILQAKKSIGLELSIPNATDSDVADFVPWLEAALPLRMSVNHWSRWTLTKDGASYRGRRVNLPFDRD